MLSLWCKEMHRETVMFDSDLPEQESMPGSSDHLLQLCSGLLARAIAACRLDHDWEQPEQIAVTLRSLDLPQRRQLTLTGGYFD